MPEFYKETLNNGLRLVTVAMPHLHSCEMVCYVGFGGRDEAAADSGVAHFLEHMLFRGCRLYPSSFDLETAFEALGGAVNASTDAETTCFHTRLHPARLQEGSALFAAMLREPLYREIDIERRIILEEALEDLNEKGEQTSPDNLTAQLLWPGHPLGRSIIGSEKTLAAIDRETLCRYHTTYYTPTNMVIAVAGPVVHGEVVSAVSAGFGAWESQPLPSPSLPAPCHGGAVGDVWVEDSDSQVTLQLAFPVPGRFDSRAVDMRLLRRLLAAGGASRLMQRLREQLGLVYHVDAGASLFADAGCFVVELATSPENLVAAVREVLANLAELRDVGVPPQELERARRSYLFDLEFSLDHPEEMAVRFGWGELSCCSRTIAEDREAVAALTAEGLQLTLKEFFMRPPVLAVVGPYRQDDRARVSSLLKQYGV